MPAACPSAKPISRAPQLLPEWRYSTQPAPDTAAQCTVVPGSSQERLDRQEEHSYVRREAASRGLAALARLPQGLADPRENTSALVLPRDPAGL